MLVIIEKYFLGDFVPIEEQTPEAVKPGKRLIREGDEDDDASGSDEERVDMSDITGKKEILQRQEAFMEAQQSKFLFAFNNILVIIK